MFRNFHEDLKSIWFFVDVAEGFVVIFMGFILLLGELFHPSIPLLFYLVEGLVDLPFNLPLFSGVIVLFLSFPPILCDLSGGRGRRGGGCERGYGFSCFESSLVWDSDGEWWWGG